MIQDVTIIIFPTKLFCHHSYFKDGVELVGEVNYFPFIPSFYPTKQPRNISPKQESIFFNPKFFKATKLLVIFSPCKIVLHQLEAKHASQ
jgi:hypothetical protein